MGCSSCGPRPGQPRDIDEGPSCDDLARFGGDEITCPECDTEVYYDATFCHECGYVLEDKSAGGPKKWIGIAAGIALISFVVVFAIR
jgi:hypothetical protein